MPRVLITDSLSKAGLERLRAFPGIEVDVRSGLTPAQVAEALQSADGIIIRSGTTLTPEILKDQRRLRVIVRAGVGVDNIDLPAATREGIVVMNTPAGNTTSTAEHSLAMLFALARNIPFAHAVLKGGKWDRKSFTGTQLAGKTLGVIGLGRIGMYVAQKAVSLEMKVAGYDPFLSPEKAAESGVVLYRNVDELLPQCDFLTVHTPLTEETRGLLDARRLRLARRGVRIVNCARGGIVDENALADALDEGHVAGAAIDVFVHEPPEPENRLVKHPKVIVTPHLGASTDEAQEAVALEAVDIITGYLLRNEVRHAVNMVPITSAEMAEMKVHLDLGRRLGLLLAQLNKGNLRAAHVEYRGDVAGRKTRLVTSSFACGLLESALDEQVNIVNAELLATERGIEITESVSNEPSDFSTLVRATVVTDRGELTAAGTVFGKQFLRLVRLGPFALDAYLDGLLLIYRHKDMPGLIGYIGTIFGKHQVNIAHMALGRERPEPGGPSVAVLNLDNEPTPQAIDEVLKHGEVQGVDLVRLPPAMAPLPWMTAARGEGASS